MKVAELAEKLGAKVLNEGVNLEGEVKSAYVCDLLSWVMAKGAQGTAWITVMNHINVIAVATLLDKAAEEGVPVLGSSKTSYELAGEMYALGLGNPVK